MKTSPDSSADGCREQALRLLNRRPLTGAELKRELSRRHYSQADFLPVIQDLIRLRVLDDLIIAENTIQNNRQSSRPVGVLKLRRKLLLRGIPETVIDGAISHGDPEENTDETDYKHAQTAARQKWNALSRSRDQRTSMMKLYRHLAGRGFPLAICRTVVREITDSRLDPEVEPS